MSREKKKSVVQGALTGTLGIFLTKALGLLYVIPFNEIAQEETVFYSYGYTIYNYVLEICLAGIPFAIAAMIAKYIAREDFEGAALVRKITRNLLLIMGIISFSVVIIFAEPLAKKVIADNIDPSQYLIYIEKTKNVLRLIAFALVSVPFLSFYRGVYQGMKEFEIYAFTQVLEQVIRIAFLLVAGALCVYVLKLPRITSVYGAMIAPTLAAVGCIVFFAIRDRKNFLKNVKIEHRERTRELIKEVVSYSVPYVSSSVFINISLIIVMFMFTSSLTKYGMDGIEITTYQGLINYQTTKITAIPIIIANGFSMALIPYLSAAVGKNDYESASALINKVIKTVVFLAVPLHLFMIFFSEEIYYVMYSSYEFAIGVEVLRKQLITTLFMNLMTIASSTLIAINLRKQYFIMEISRCLVYMLIMPLMLQNVGVNGYFIVFTAVYGISFIVDLIIIERHIDCDMHDIVKKCIMILICCVPVVVTFVLKRFIDLDVLGSSRLVSLIYGGMMGVLAASGYLVIAQLMGLIRELFDIDLSIASIKQLIGRFTGRSE
ncbi:MAG: oligosaccharide flippase family protein [Erysipelotrichaceae bacterium]|nr:oligosaccharide flippase family protein [Erysipelotrichaceae bacterium]